MSDLRDILLVETRKRLVTADCVGVIEQYVSGRGGLRGIGMKTGIGMIKAARPDAMLRVIGHLLPEIVATLEPCHAESVATGKSFDATVKAHRSRVANELVAMADRRMTAVQNATAKSMYKRFRGDAEAEVIAALPLLSRALDRYRQLDTSA